jgi:hypothetical protein
LVYNSEFVGFHKEILGQVLGLRQELEEVTRILNANSVASAVPQTIDHLFNKKLPVTSTKKLDEVNQWADDEHNY